MSPRTRADELLGVALAPASVTAAAASVPTVWQGDIELHGTGNGTRDALAAALKEAARASGVVAPGLIVALLPPLAETRTVPLPALREDDRNLFLARNAARYFVGARGPQIVATRDVGGVPQNDAGPRPVLATAMAQQLMHVVQGAATDSGCGLRGVVPAESAWAAAAVAIWPALARGPAVVIVAREGRADALTLADGALAGVRRLRGAVDALEMVSLGVAAGGTRFGVLGPVAEGEAVTAALEAAGARVLRPDAKWRELAGRPDALAARFAAASTGLEIRSEESRAEQRANVRRAAWAVLVAAAAMVVAAPAVHYVGLRRELANVEAMRAAIRPQVNASLVGRSSVDAAYRQVAALAAASRDARRWSVALADLAAQLPMDASLSAFRARGDSLFMDGVAERAAPIFDVIGRMPGLGGVRATAPVRREATEGAAPLEHFSLGAELAGARR